MIEGAGLEAVGFGPRVAALIDDAVAGRPEADPARVVRAEKGHVRLAIAGDELLLAVAPDIADGGPLVVGDWVAVAPGPDGEPEVAAVVERWSALVRHDPDERRPQVLVANVDVVGLVHGMDRPFRPGRIERFLAAAWESGARPVVIVTKADLADPGDVVAEIEQVALGVEVLVTSTVDRTGIDELAVLLAPSATGVLLGESGAGKSSLVNGLLGEERLDTGEVRKGDYKGRHTTTARELVPLPQGGVLIDTPGVRAFAPWDAADGLRQVFADIDEMAASCRFRDCRHDAEPGCAVLDALDDGSLDPGRLDRFRSLRAEQESWELRQDEAARRAASRQQGRLYRQVKNRPSRGDR